MKKSIFKASFEESLNLLDDASLQYIKKDYYEKLGKGLNNGKPSIGFRIKSILYSILFVFGGNFLLALFAFSLNDADPKDLTLPVHKPSLLTPELFLICCFIWLSFVLIGKFVRKPFLRPYRYRFHIETFLFWFCLEFNLLGITIVLPTLTSLGIWFIFILLFIIALIFLRMEKRSLTTCFFGEEARETLVDRIAGLIATYGSGVLCLSVIIKIILSHSGVAVSQSLTLLGLFLTWLIIDIGFLAMVIFMEFPFFLEGFYKWKYPEEYRDWEGKSVEDWYGKKYLKKYKKLLKAKMKKKSIFKASFEESLNLLDDSVSGKYDENLYQDALKKEKYRGTLKSYIWLVILTILFIIGPNWLIVALNDYLFYHANPRDLTVHLSEINFLPYWVFWMGLAIWILLIILGKRFNQQFILIYRGQFHFMVSFIIWLFIELNLFLMNLLYGLVGYLGMFAFEGLIFFTIIYMIRDKSTSLLNLLYGGTEIESPTDRLFNRVFRFIVKYGGIVVALWIIFRTIFSDSIRNADSLVGGLSVLFLFLMFNILIAAFEIYFMFPYMLQGYYKLKYPEEYRDWEGKSVEDWYGKKHKGKFK